MDGIDEIKTEALDEQTAEATSTTEVETAAADTEPTAETETTAADTTAETATTEAEPQKKRKLPAFLEKFIAYLKTHEDVRQMVLFFLFSMICGGTQMILTYGLSAGLQLADSLKPAFSWFVFKYATTAEFIGFLVGSVVGQVLTFVLNRKKTFNVPNYLVMRAIMYAVMAILIIIMQTYLGGVVTKACWDAKPDADGFLGFLFNLTGQAVAGIAALVINFLGNKFFVMRDWGGKIKKANEEKALAEAALAAAADDANGALAEPTANEATSDQQ